jgi:hypothetical protein
MSCNSTITTNCQVCETKLPKKAGAVSCCGMILCRQCINSKYHYCNASIVMETSRAKDMYDVHIGMEKSQLDEVYKAADLLIQNSKKLSTVQQKINLLQRGLDIAVNYPDIYSSILKEYNELIGNLSSQNIPNPPSLVRNT